MAETTRNCPNCNIELQSDDKFCPQCGANLNILGKVLFSSFLKDQINEWSPPKGSFSNLLQKSILRGSGWKQETVDKLVGEDENVETRKFRKYVSDDPFKELAIKATALIIFILFMFWLIRRV